MEKYYLFIDHMNSDSSFLLAFSICLVIFAIAFIIDMKIVKIEINIEEGKLLEEYDVESVIVKRRKRLVPITQGTFFVVKEVVSVSFKLDSKVKTVEFIDSNIYDNFKKGDICLLVIKEVNYNNKNYSYVCLKDESISKKKVFLKSREHRIGKISVSVLFLVMACFVLSKLLNIISLLV